MQSESRQIEGLYADVEWALAQGLPERELIAMLQRLAKAAAPRSEYFIYAQRNLAELLVRRSPFRAARLAQSVLSVRDDDRAFAVLGLSHMLMGNYKSAEKAYRSALALLPHCPWYAHNLGHLLDVGLGRPEEALAFLRIARRGLPHEPEIASSHAHALLRSGDRAGAERELRVAVSDEREARGLLDQWAKEEPSPPVS